MSSPAPHFQHATPLFLFEETFAPLIEQSKNIVIRYGFSDHPPDLENGDSLTVVSVNGCPAPADFGKMLSDLANASLVTLEKYLENLQPVHADPVLAQVLIKLASLSKIIDTDQLQLQNIPGSEPVYRSFRCFSSFRLDGPFRGCCQLFSQAIAFKAESFAETWLSVIAATCDHLQLIRKMVSNYLADEVSRIKQLNKASQGYSLKFNLSVPQIGFLFRMFDVTNLIEVPNRGNPELIDWITSNFQSKGRESIQPKSLRNKLFTPDLAALDFWENQLAVMQHHIKQERDRLLK
jgi:hypothetical protein